MKIQLLYEIITINMLIFPTKIGSRSWFTGIALNKLNKANTIKQ